MKTQCLYDFRFVALIKHDFIGALHGGAAPYEVIVFFGQHRIHMSHHDLKFVPLGWRLLFSLRLTRKGYIQETKSKVKIAHDLSPRDHLLGHISDGQFQISTVKSLLHFSICTSIVLNTMT